MPRPSPRAFGVRIAGVALVLPQGETLEYLPEVAVHPLPGAPRHVVGLMQLRGHPVVVLDGGTGPVAAAATVHVAVVVVGQPPDGAALVVDAAPLPLDALSGVERAVPPACAFVDALGAAVADAEGGTWWPVDARRLFETLAVAP